MFVDVEGDVGEIDRWMDSGRSKMGKWVEGWRSGEDATGGGRSGRGKLLKI